MSKAMHNETFCKALYEPNPDIAGRGVGLAPVLDPRETLGQG